MDAANILWHSVACVVAVRSLAVIQSTSMVALAPNTSEASTWDVLDAFPKLHSRAREARTTACAEVPMLKSRNCIEIWLTIYESCDRLESFTRDPIGYVDGPSIYASYLRLSAVDPSGLSWGTGDFLWHYWFGFGATVDLGDVGLADVYWGHPSVVGQTDAFKARVAAAMIGQWGDMDCDQSFSWTHSFSSRNGPPIHTNVTDTIFVVGDSTGLTFTADCSINIGPCSDGGCTNCRPFSVSCDFSYLLRDSFRDPLDSEEWGFGTVEVGIPYDITSSKNESFSAKGNSCDSPAMTWK